MMVVNNPLNKALFLGGGGNRLIENKVAVGKKHIILSPIFGGDFRGMFIAKPLLKHQYLL